MDDYRRAVIADASKKYGTRLLTYRELTDFMREHGVVPCSQSTARLWSDRGWLPPAYSLISRIVVWREDELLSWARAKRKQAQSLTKACPYGARVA